MRSLSLLLILLGILGLGGCTVDQGKSCEIDSDCAPGTLCSLEGTCETFETVADILAHAGNSISTDAGALEAKGWDCLEEGECTARKAVFESSTETCLEPAEKRVVSLLAIAETGHAAANLGTLGNGIIASGFEDGTIHLELWVDGDFGPGCEYTVAWMRSDDDRKADCTAVFTDTMPFSIPELVQATVYEAQFDPCANTVSGLLNKAEILASMDEAIRETAGNLIDEDVDSDGDGVNDRTTVILELTFEE